MTTVVEGTVVVVGGRVVVVAATVVVGGSVVVASSGRRVVAPSGNCVTTGCFVLSRGFGVVLATVVVSCGGVVGGAIVVVGTRHRSLTSRNLAGSSGQGSPNNCIVAWMVQVPRLLQLVATISLAFNEKHSDVVTGPLVHVTLSERPKFASWI